MLQKHTVKRPLWDVLTALQKEPMFSDYFLVGGTALSLQIGHRESEDIDLFTKKEIEKDRIKSFLDKKYGKIDIINSQESIYQIEINNLKVDFVSYPYNLIEEIKEEEGIRFLGKKDLSAMKLAAISNRGNKAKDFVDIYYLLKEIRLQDIFSYYKKKYNDDNIFHVKKSLVYFDDVPENSWNSIKMIKDRLNVNDVKNALINEVNRLEKKTEGESTDG